MSCTSGSYSTQNAILLLLLLAAGTTLRLLLYYTTTSLTLMSTCSSLSTSSFAVSRFWNLHSRYNSTFFLISAPHLSSISLYPFEALTGISRFAPVVICLSAAKLTFASATTLRQTLLGDIRSHTSVSGS